MRRTNQQPDDGSRTFDPNVEPGSGDEGNVKLKRVITEVISRRAAGQFFPDERVIRENPELMPRLVDELSFLEQIHRAKLAAEKAGPLNDPLRILSADELEAPIVDDESALVTPQPELRIHGYIILHEVSSGGQAVVYKAIHEPTRRKVAVKVVHGVHSRVRTRIDREADILAVLDHPNVVKILDRGRTADGSFFITMDFVEGYSLDEFTSPACATGPATLVDLVNLFIRICKAIDQAHKLGIVHRDLKPSNIRVDTHGEPHILDFGLAGLAADADVDWMSHTTITQPGQILGSIPWSSPEQAAGRHDDVRASSDVYALGLIVYEAIAGSPPYTTRGLISTVVHEIVNATPKPLVGERFDRWGQIDAGLDAILQRCLAKSPEQRYATAGSLATALERWLVEPASSHTTRQSLRPWFIALVATAVILVGSLAASHFWKVTPAGNPKHVERPTTMNSIDMRLVKVFAGEFLMGSPDHELNRDNQERLRRVTISKDFYMGTCEVTQKQFQAIMNDLPEQVFKGDNLPAQRITWEQAERFCKLLSEKERKTYRLPTEAEWEYACRAGTTNQFSAAELKLVGWYKENLPPQLPPVGSLPPNAWGLHDMHGSVQEWCSDWFGPYEGDEVLDPPGSGWGLLRVLRGGDFRAEPERCRSAKRNQRQPDAVIDTIGFRVVLETGGQ